MTAEKHPEKALRKGAFSCLLTVTEGSVNFLQQPRSNATAMLENCYNSPVRLLQQPRRKFTGLLRNRFVCHKAIEKNK